MPNIYATRRKPSKIRRLKALPEIQEILTTEQTRKVLGVSYNTLRRYIERGYIDCFWIGSRRAFRRTDIENLIFNGCAESSVASNSNVES